MERVPDDGVSEAERLWRGSGTRLLVTPASAAVDAEAVAARWRPARGESASDDDGPEADDRLRRLAAAIGAGDARIVAISPAADAGAAVTVAVSCRERRHHRSAPASRRAPTVAVTRHVPLPLVREAAPQALLDFLLAHTAFQPALGA